uniref:TBC1 domain family member 10A n=1 Tax=Bos mutus grunniens TaxID=30521 RepID=A0A8B9YHR7_BOSMU
MGATRGRGVGGVGGGREAEAAEVAAEAEAAGAARMAKSFEENGPRAPAAQGSLSGTRESLAPGPDAAAADELSSLGSDSETNGFAERRIDKFGFIVGSQGAEGALEEVPLEVLRQRESKWLDMLNNWDKWMAKKHKKIRLRCQKGIPPSLRGRAWQYLSGGKVKLQQNPGKFDELDMSPGDPKWLDVIERDLHRQFPFHEMFVSRGGHGQQDLFRVLKAYTLYRPEEGYCQAQAPIAAVLLMHMPAEQAFWCLVQICEKYLPGYYSEKLEAIQLDGEILFSLLQKVSPVAHKHLSQQKIDPLLYMTEWFMCAFSRTLPWSSVLRVWDMFFCEGTGLGSAPLPPVQFTGGPLFAEKLPRAAPTAHIHCLPPCRSQDHLPGGLGAAEAGAGLPREGPRLPRPVRDHRAAAEPQPQGHAGGVPGPGGGGAASDGAPDRARAPHPAAALAGDAGGAAVPVPTQAARRQGHPGGRAGPTAQPAALTIHPPAPGRPPLWLQRQVQGIQAGPEGAAGAGEGEWAAGPAACCESSQGSGCRRRCITPTGYARAGPSPPGPPGLGPLGLSPPPLPGEPDVPGERGHLLVTLVAQAPGLGSPHTTRFTD